MKLKIKNMILSLIALLTLIAIQSPSTSAYENEQLNHSLEIRKKLGLNTDVNEVSRINANFQVTENNFGIPLTIEELAEMNVRAELIAEASDFQNNLAELGLSSIFSGLYLDHQDNGTLKIGLVNLDKQTQNIETIKNLFASSNKERIKFFNTTLNENQLIKLQNEINLLMDRHPINYTDISVKSNKVIVGVSENNADVSQAILNLSPRNIEIRKEPILMNPNSRTSYSRPLKGGLAIQLGGYCTGSVTARKQQSNSSYKYYYITAAHCGEVNSTWTQGGVIIGKISYRNYGGQSDMAAIEINSAHASHKIYNTLDGTPSDVDITAIEHKDVVGTYLCMAGYSKTYPQCGTLESKNYSAYNQLGVKFTNLRTTNITSSVGGDSGGPYYARGPSDPIEKRRFHGVHNGLLRDSQGNPIGTYYSHVNRIFADLGMDQILTEHIAY
ncbi:S1 family peptidase [Paenibacillus sp. SC116]|uniref:S1 family peptidase n=1 Tax=Paenibacillus sp. SC116 TaxID=2968986 RepID=UPI00215B395F|nr:S1 family peptidase [Paenibacillus sp. SC116]MCR8845377.1 S1 family peptidase [Paenibacillus sp. SC116]